MPCFRHPVAQLFMAGFLPFSAIYIELHYIFNSIWGHKIYTLFGILFLAFIMLFIVTSFITIALIYFQVLLLTTIHHCPSSADLPPLDPLHHGRLTLAILSFLQLAREDHRWWWRSFFNGGATGLFILGYSFFYYFQRSEMDGFFQVTTKPWNLGILPLRDLGNQRRGSTPA